MDRTDGKLSIGKSGNPSETDSSDFNVEANERILEILLEKHILSCRI